MYLINVLALLYTTASPSVNVYEPPAASLQLLSSWTNVFPTERVQLICNISGVSDWTITWHKNGHVQGPDISVSFSADGSVLTITSAALTHTGSYICKGLHKTKGVATENSNSLEIDVHANKPKPSVSRRPDFDRMFVRESVTFTCAVNMGSGWKYKWFYNGAEVHNTDTYTIASLGLSNSGRYTCRAKRGSFETDESETASLQVSDPPTPSLKLLSPWLNVFKGERVELLCEVHGSDWSYTWYKQQQKLLLDVSEPSLNITEITNADDGVYTCKVHLESRNVISRFSNNQTVVVYENTPKSTVSRVPGFNPMYVGEHVKLTCDVDIVSPGWNYKWYKDGPMLISATNKTLSLRLGLTDGDNYSCKAVRGGTTWTGLSAKITLEVRRIPVPRMMNATQWLDVFRTESVKLSCGMMDGSSGWTYTWYKDGQKVQADGVASLDSDGSTLSIKSASVRRTGQYKCKGHLLDRSVHSNVSAGQTLTVYDEIPIGTLTQDPDYAVMFSGESVSFSCHIDVSSGWEYIYYKDGNRQANTGVAFTVESVQKVNRGSYKCKARRGSTPEFYSRFSRDIKLSVEEKKPKPLMTQEPNADRVYVGESVSFACKVGISSGWEFLWYKDGAALPYNSSSFTVHHATSSHGGVYQCQAKRDKSAFHTEQSDMQHLQVSEIPVPAVKNATQWLDVFPTESVTLSCGMMDGSSDWTYTWYRDGQKVQADDVVSLESGGSTLSIRSASAEHAGQYSCSGTLKIRPVHSKTSTALTLSVYDEIPTGTLTQDPDYAVMFSGESVSFSCHIDVSSGWEYIYYKDGNRQANTGVAFTVESVQKVNGGSYKCRVRRGSTPEFNSRFSRDIKLSVEEKKPKPLMTQEPNADRVYVGMSVSFACKVGISSGWEFLWYKDGAALPYNSSSFTVHHATSSHGGVYQCQAKRDKSAFHTEQSDMQRLQVSEIPVPAVKNATQWLDVFPTESVTLSCGMMDGSSDWTYTWYRDGQKVQADDVVSLDSDGSTLSIRSASAEHAGQYSCLGTLKIQPVHSKTSTALTLSVYETKPRVTLTRTPEYDVMHTEDAVSFSCHVNVSSGWHFLWYQDNRPLPESGNKHNIASVVTRNSGSYSCRVQRGASAVFQSDQSRAVKLNVQERPQANVALLTGWSEVFSTDSLMLRCDVQGSKDLWNYTWSREGQHTNLSISRTHMVRPADDPQQSLYTCQGVRSGRPSYSQRSASFKTKNLLLKRRILLSISGCLFFGLVAVFLGCIVLRFTRKSVDDDEKPEEENLFLTMAQLKDRDDAPNPLAEYLTDEALNASSEDAEENGKISSESTPLPITTQEEQAVTPESKETDGNNGLVSFKQ
ncbi:hemicentin-1-like [Solea solea]|uniref:hemicentin-1-like n=1 Tax=Solea solea TaxID=90069 RepID=UPI00272BA559|nr:hemicentin-1-like [Solea solea]